MGGARVAFSRMSYMECSHWKFEGKKTHREAASKVVGYGKERLNTSGPYL